MINYYNRFIQHYPLLLQLLYALVKPFQRCQSVTLEWTPQVDAAFLTPKETLSDTITFSYIDSDEISIATDASDSGTRAVLQQRINGACKPIAFFSQKLSNSESRYGVYDKELLAIFRVVKLLRYFTESYRFHILTDHKTLTTTFLRNTDSYTPRQLCHMDYISQFTTNIRYINGADNNLSDALSCNITAATSSSLDYAAISADHPGDDELQQPLQNLALQMRKITLPGIKVTLNVDVSTQNVRS